MRSPLFDARLPAAALLLLIPSLFVSTPRALHAVAPARPAPRDSAALLLEEGAQVRRDGREGSVLRALEVWERARAVAARQGDTAAQARALHLRGEAFSAIARYDSAFASLNAALALRPAGAGPVARGETLVELARAELAVGRPDRARVGARAALDLCAGADGAAARAVEAGARTVLGGVLRLSGSRDSTFAELRRAVELRHAAGDAPGEGEALRITGETYRRVSSFDSALATYRRALALQEGAGDRRGAAWTLRAASQTYERVGQRDSAEAFTRRALDGFVETGDRRGEALALADLARYRRGEAPDSALARAHRALALVRQVGDRGGEASVLTDIAITLRDAGQVDSSAAVLEQALELYRQAGDASGEGWMLAELGNVQRDAGRLDSARVLYRRAVWMRRRVSARAGEAWVLNDLAGIHMQLGDTDSARVACERGLAIVEEIGEHSLEAQLRISRGDLYQIAGDYPGAEAAYAAALRLHREVGNRSGEAVALGRLGEALLQLGRADSARARLREALVASRETGNAGEEADVLLLLGSLAATSGQADSSIIHYRQSLEAGERAGSLRRQGSALAGVATQMSRGWMLDSARVYAAAALERFRRTGEPRLQATLIDGTLADLEIRLGRPDSAMSFYRQALELHRRAGNVSGEARVLLHIGETFGGERPDSARAYMRQAIDIFRRGGDGEGAGWALAALGRVTAQVHPDSGLALLREAYDLGRTTNQAPLALWTGSELGELHRAAGRADSAQAYHWVALALARETGDTGAQSEALEHLADLQRARGRPGARAALTLYDSAAAVLSRVVGGVGGDDDRVSLQEFDAALWGNWTLAWLTQDGRDARLAALAVGERGRARALLELMRRSSAATAAERPVRPGADLAAEGRALLAAARPGGGAILIYQLAGDTLLRWLVPAHGDPLVFPAAVPRDTLAALVRAARAALGADEAAGRGAGGRRAAPLEPPAPAAAPYRGALERLARLLVPDSLAARLPAGGEVVVVPAGPLNLVPFAALPLADGEYLGARHALRYAPSLAALAQAAGRPAPGRGELAHALVVGNPAMPTITTYTGEEVELDPLPGAEREADQVADRLGTRALHGAQAGEKALASLLSGAPLVHLATHGFAYAAPGRAGESFVALAPGEGEDGLLTVSEVLHKMGGMRAELVVLSACQTGLGSLQEAEGTVGLQRAFLGQGARSVMVSLWSVSDRATEALMQGFYQHWLNDADHPAKAEALRRAQADVRAIPGFESPLFWAAFQLAGAG
ncbi:MAG TPA: CHAT domain-containing tetratricopeptide repeat protein [Longimicrobium sp.]|nr:CHAT domain-containing tetratricopeptide repeat protein [Longimicrobium sp.]